MIKLILRNKRYTAREYWLRYDYVIISIVRYRFPWEKPPVMIKTYIIRQLLIFPEPVYRCHLIQQRVKIGYIVAACVGFCMVYTPLILLKGITTPNWKIQIRIRLEKNPKFIRWRIKQVNYYFYIRLKFHLKILYKKRDRLKTGLFYSDIIITLRRMLS